MMTMLDDIETIAGRELVAGKKWRGLCLEYEADVSALDSAEVLDVGDAALAERDEVIRELAEDIDMWRWIAKQAIKRQGGHKHDEWLGCCENVLEVYRRQYADLRALNMQVSPVFRVMDAADAALAERDAVIVEQERTINEAARLIFRMEGAYNGIFDEDEAAPVIIADLRDRSQEADHGR